MSTYQLGPFENERFIPSKIDGILKRTVDGFFSKMDPSITKLEPQLNALADRVKSVVKTEGSIPRHKISVQCYAVQNLGQSVCLSSKSLWDSSVDNYSSYTYEFKDFFITVIILAFYQE
jgi:hypothetical protein